MYKALFLCTYIFFYAYIYSLVWYTKQSLIQCLIFSLEICGFDTLTPMKSCHFPAISRGIYPATMHKELYSGCNSQSFTSQNLQTVHMSSITHTLCEAPNTLHLPPWSITKFKESLKMAVGIERWLSDLNADVNGHESVVPKF